MKFFVATVSVSQTITVEVSAIDEQTAQEMARAEALRALDEKIKPGRPEGYGFDPVGRATVQQVDLGLRSECPFDPGTRVSHDELGGGEVLTTVGSYLGVWTITVKFDSGETRELDSPPAALLVELRNTENPQPTAKTTSSRAGGRTTWQVGTSDERLESDDDVPMGRLRARIQSDAKRWARTGLVFEGVDSEFLPGSQEDFVITGQGYRLFGRRRDGYWPVDALLKAGVDDWTELAS